MYTKAVALNPAYADAYHNAGLTLQELARYEEVIRDTRMNCTDKFRPGTRTECSVGD